MITWLEWNCPHCQDFPRSLWASLVHIRQVHSDCLSCSAEHLTLRYLWTHPVEAERLERAIFDTDTRGRG